MIGRGRCLRQEFFLIDLLVKHDQTPQKIGNSGVRHRNAKEQDNARCCQVE
jgi:hypothetical protein